MRLEPIDVRLGKASRPVGCAISNVGSKVDNFLDRPGFARRHQAVAIGHENLAGKIETAHWRLGNVIKSRTRTIAATGGPLIPAHRLSPDHPPARSLTEILAQ